MSRSNRPGPGIPGYAVVTGVFGFGIGVLWSGSPAVGAVAGLAVAGAVVALLVAVQIRGRQ